MSERYSQRETIHIAASVGGSKELSKAERGVQYSSNSMELVLKLSNPCFLNGFLLVPHGVRRESPLSRFSYLQVPESHCE